MTPQAEADRRRPVAGQGDASGRHSAKALRPVDAKQTGELLDGLERSGWLKKITIETKGRPAFGVCILIIAPEAETSITVHLLNSAPSLSIAPGWRTILRMLFLASLLICLSSVKTTIRSSLPHPGPA